MDFLQGANEQKLLEFLKVGAAPSPSSWLTRSTKRLQTLSLSAASVLPLVFASDSVLPDAE